MTSIHQARERLESANVVPASTALPAGTWSRAELLERIQERSEVMTETQTKVRPLPPERARNTRRGPLIALATAAAVLVVGTVFAFAALTGENREVGASANPEEVVFEFLDRYQAGDVDGFEALIAQDAAWGCYSCGAIEGYWQSQSTRNIQAKRSWYMAATGATFEASCTTEGAVVTCQRHKVSGLTPGAPFEHWLVSYTIADGQIVDSYFEPDWDKPEAYDTAGLVAYESWLEELHPAVRDQLFGNGTTMLYDTEELRTLHRQYIADYLEAIGGA